MVHNTFLKKIIASSIGIGFILSPIEANAYNLHTWVVDWDRTSYQEYSRKYNSVSNFAVSFNEDLTMNVPDKFNGKNVYLSFVNDLQDSPKDQELLRDLFHNDESMNHLINEMIKNSQGYYGIELDFEGFWKDKELTQKYMLFTYRLYYQCIKHDLKLRIVLEPSFTEQDYMKGPEYVVMCYNLYGKHSTPGPKANYEFIDKLVEKAKILPKVSFAIANGGCVWTVSGGAKYLTYNEIQKLKPKDVFRDSSDALIGRIDDGVTYYADDITIKKWKRYLNDKGYDVAIWRLGGNK